MFSLYKKPDSFFIVCIMSFILSCSEGSNDLPVNLWKDSTAETIGITQYWTNRVDIADLNGDGLPDILCAIGGTNNAPLDPELSRVYFNLGAENGFQDVSELVFGDKRWISRVIKARDINSDGHADIVVGTAFSNQSRLYLGDGTGNFNDVTTTHLPQINRSVSDLEFGDIDEDGDIDIVMSDWGLGDPAQNDGGRPMLWLNDGNGRFTDVTEVRIPDVRAKFAWECELVDVDNDYDLDFLVTARFNESSFLFENDGNGMFTDVSQKQLPQYPDNYDFEAIDMNGDDFLDLVTINDGEKIESIGSSSRRQHIFFNDGTGKFIDVSSTHWPDAENPAHDDNVAAYLDYDSDGDADVMIASLTGPDRLLVNDGKGHLRMAQDVLYGGRPTEGTLHLTVADLNRDGKIDVIQAQGETVDKIEEGAFEDKVYLGTNIPVDTAPPVISLVEEFENINTGDSLRIRARIHDNKSPTLPFEWQSAVLQWTRDNETHNIPMEWYGEYLWRAEIIPVSSGTLTYRICATDANGNETCSDMINVQ